ncbi:MAG: hypothetical protein JWN39_124 [Ilumatobacteraceae bacterium]|nr:hypothetical protein [Ilumatobacteraceae bacterium]
MLDRTLPKAEWTHEGHVLACLSIVSSMGAVRALEAIRAAIPPYNEATGVANTTTGGYHDTITVYYVWAVDRLLAAGATPTQVLADPLASRTAPLEWWDRGTLMSSQARAAWLPPSIVSGDGPELPR